MRFMTICWIYKVVGRIVVSAAACYKTKRSALLVWWKSKLMADCQLNCGQLPGYNGSTFLSKILKKSMVMTPFRVHFLKVFDWGSKGSICQMPVFCRYLARMGCTCGQFVTFQYKKLGGGSNVNKWQAAFKGKDANGFWFNQFLFIVTTHWNSKSLPWMAFYFL